MGKKLVITTRTTITPYNGNKKIMPKAPVWVVKNTSEQVMSINGSHALVTSDGFGVDSSAVFSMAAYMAEKNIEVVFENNTQIEITFSGPGAFGKGTFTLIETFIDYKWQ